MMNLIDEAIATGEEAAAKEAARPKLLGDFLQKDIERTRGNFANYAKRTIEGNAPKFAEGTTEFLGAGKLGERLEVRDVDIASCQLMAIEEGGLFTPEHLKDKPVLLLRTPGKHDFPLRKHAFSQLCALISAPPGYLVTLPPEHALKCVRYGIDKLGHGKHTLRTERGEVRAIVSSRYAPLDDEQVVALLEAALKKMGRLDDAQVENWSAGTTSSLTVSFGNVVQGVDKGYAHHAAGGASGEGLGLRGSITTTNGELGNAGVKVSPSLWRAWCSNGALLECVKMWSRRHQGTWAEQAEDLADTLIEILRISNHVIEKATPGALADMVNPVDISKRLDALKLSKHERNETLKAIVAEALGLYTFDVEHAGFANVNAQRDAELVMAELAKAKKDEERDAVLAELATRIPDGQFNGWQIINGVTATARDMENADRAAELEGIGGRLLAQYLN